MKKSEKAKRYQPLELRDITISSDDHFSNIAIVGYNIWKDTVLNYLV